MIRYIYDLHANPEPTHVRRVRAWHVGEGEYPSMYGDVWVRKPCTYHSEMPPERRGRYGARYGERRIKRRNKHVWRYGAGTCNPSSGPVYNSQYCETHPHDGSDCHGHWFNGSKYRAWHHLRGADVAADLDVFRRMRQMYRQRNR